jgi:hypothetical protein
MKARATFAEECARPRAQQLPQAKDAFHLNKHCPLPHISAQHCFRPFLRPGTGALRARGRSLAPSCSSP